MDHEQSSQKGLILLIIHSMENNKISCTLKSVLSRGLTRPTLSFTPFLILFKDIVALRMNFIGSLDEVFKIESVNLLIQLDLFLSQLQNRLSILLFLQLLHQKTLVSTLDASVSQ